ncbi:hypothetical protein L1987_01873 [Smallanthus sonchifolius]|uniref:Uncharacterized protein n=1 Tax=Smallanthus sonchifolius TaxID=185202 RepID=A0ACB9K685_9ASTR|nr:hypothetical protein L1987_01873 [Smallanthus sonchifolius]
MAEGRFNCRAEMAVVAQVSRWKYGAGSVAFHGDRWRLLFCGGLMSESPMVVSSGPRNRRGSFMVDSGDDGSTTGSFG